MILVTELARVTEVRLVQFLKVPHSTLVMELPIVAVVIPVQSKKTPLPILVTELGIATDERDVQFLNYYCPLNIFKSL